MSFLIFLLLGIVIGIIIATTSDSHLSLLTASDKVFYDYVNGKVGFSKQVSRLIFSTMILDVIFFILSLNYYLSYLTYLVIAYQGSLMFLSVTAVIAEYSFRGVLMTIFLSLPVNIIIFVFSIIFASVCVSRSFVAHKNKSFSYGLNNKNFWISLIGLLLLNIAMSFIISFLFNIILRSRIFIIF